MPLPGRPTGTLLHDLIVQEKEGPVGEIGAAVDKAIAYLAEHPDEARYTDSPATARMEDGLRFTVEGPGGMGVTTDMPPSVGGEGSAPSPGWLFRAAMASCIGTVAAMRAAQRGIRLDRLEVEVDSESDDRGLLGIDPSIPSGPLSMSVRIGLSGPGASEEELREVAMWGKSHCPVCDAAERAVDVQVTVTPV
jgi:uncharacterized OsmC-like protein